MTDIQAQRLREIDELLAECQRHNESGVRVSYAQLRALRDSAAVPAGYRLQPLSEYEAMRSALDLPEGNFPRWKEALIAEMQSSYDTDGITHEDSGDPLIYLQSAIAIVEDFDLVLDGQTPERESVPDGGRLVIELRAIRDMDMPAHDEWVLNNDQRITLTWAMDVISMLDAKGGVFNE